MKIISVDNLDRETYDDALIAENIENKVYGEVMVDALNVKFSGENADRFYKLVPDAYELHIFEP